MLAIAFRKATMADPTMSWGEASVVALCVVLTAVPAVAALYVVKSALGINLMDGPSVLHDVLYQFAR